MSGARARLSFEDVLEVIDHFVRQRQPARLASVAAELGVAPRTVQRVAAADGYTFSSAVNESRLYVAAHELIINGAPVRQAGEVAGFATTSDFCAVFTAFFGVSPGALGSAALHEELSSEEIASAMTRDGLDLFQELMKERAPNSFAR